MSLFLEPHVVGRILLLERILCLLVRLQVDFPSRCEFLLLWLLCSRLRLRLLLSSAIASRVDFQHLVWEVRKDLSSHASDFLATRRMAFSWLLLPSSALPPTLPALLWVAFGITDNDVFLFSNFSVRRVFLADRFIFDFDTLMIRRFRINRAKRCPFILRGVWNLVKQFVLAPKRDAQLLLV